MIDDQFTPEEQDLIRRLREEPKPQIDPNVSAAIRENMISEFRAVIASGQASTPVYRPHVRIAPILAAVAALVLVALVITQITRPPVQTSDTLTPQTQIAVVPSNTVQPTDAAFTPTAVTLTNTPAPVLATATAQGPTLTDIPVIPTSTQETTLVVEGPVSAISGNILTVYDLAVEVAPGHPILSLLDVGDFVRVEGMYKTGGTVAASVVGNLDEVIVVDGETATVNLEGSVESIDENQVVVNGITVELDPDDPLLATLAVGNFVQVRGNFAGSGATIILVVVNVTVINDAQVIEDDCWYHADAMGMGHWHCDGMGMGMGGMGMGMER